MCRPPEKPVPIGRRRTNLCRAHVRPGTIWPIPKPRSFERGFPRFKLFVTTFAFMLTWAFCYGDGPQSPGARFQFVSCAPYGPDHLIQFQMDGTGIPILRILDQKDHEEGDDCRSSIDNKLPSIRIVVSWTESCPDNNRTYRQTKSPRGTDQDCNLRCNLPKPAIKGIPRSSLHRFHLITSQHRRLGCIARLTRWKEHTVMAGLQATLKTAVLVLVRLLAYLSRG